MPELPEVETVARQLSPMLCDRRVLRVALLDARLGSPPVARLQGRTIERVFRSGKQVAFEFAGQRGPYFMAVHLRMTGRLIGQDDRQSVEQRHLRARFDLEGARLLFYDPRRFGTLVLASTQDEITSAGVDPLAASLSPHRLGQLLRGSRQSIKSWLLRQDRLVGLGNIYASEILHQAGIDPQREAGKLRQPAVKRLHRAMRDILARAIECCGTTFSDFQDAHGVTGSYQQFLAVYGHEGEPCPVCSDTVQRIVQQQRSTFFCPRCQL